MPETLTFQWYIFWGWDHLQPQKDKPSPGSKRKRRTKNEDEQLKAQILYLWELGYDGSAIHLILEVRADMLRRLILDIVEAGHLRTTARKQIFPAKKLPGLHDIDKSEYWEATHMANGEIRLIPIALSDPRKSLGFGR